MLFETANQFSVFLCLIYLGIIAGLIDIFPALMLKSKHKFFRCFSDLSRPILFFMLFFISTVICCFGEIRLFAFIAFLIGFFVCKFFYNANKKIFCLFKIKNKKK